MKEERILEELQKMSESVTNIMSFVNLFMPRTLSVTALSEALGKDTKTIRMHLEGNFIKDVDYFQKVEKGKIIIPRSTAFNVAKYYMDKGAKNA